MPNYLKIACSLLLGIIFLCIIYGMESELPLLITLYTALSTIYISLSIGYAVLSFMNDNPEWRKSIKQWLLKK